MFLLMCPSHVFLQWAQCAATMQGDTLTVGNTARPSSAQTPHPLCLRSIRSRSTARASALSSSAAWPTTPNHIRPGVPSIVSRNHSTNHMLQ